MLFFLKYLFFVCKCEDSNMFLVRVSMVMIEFGIGFVYRRSLVLFIIDSWLGFGSGVGGLKGVGRVYFVFFFERRGIVSEEKLF